MTIDQQDAPSRYDPSYQRRGPGPRTVQRREQKKTARRRLIRNLTISTALLTAIFIGLSQIPAIHLPVLFAKKKAAAIPHRSVDQRTQQSWLIIGTRSADVSGDADWLSVFSYDRRAKAATVIYIPRSTLVEIPGHGQDTLDKSLSLGNEPLLVSATSNLLGIAFDHFLKISDQGLQALFDKFAGVTIDVDQKLPRTDPDGKVRSAFVPGKQPLDGKRTAEFLLYLNADGDEISRATRHAKVWQAVLDHFRADPASFGALMRDSSDLYATDVSDKAVEDFFKSMASTTVGSANFETLPVQANGVQSGTQFYGPDRDGIERLVERYLSGSRPIAGRTSGRRIEILNGNGKPGVGEEVSRLLIPKGFRLVLDNNARSFDYTTTQIVIYSDSKAALAIAQEIRATLGVGEVVISRQHQTIVDVTLVIGKDYLDKKG